MGFNFFMKRPQSDLPVEKKPVVKVIDKKPQIEPVSHDANNQEVKPVYGFIDASNLFWGGKASLGFNIDYKKFLNYLKTKYGITKVFYYGGIRTFEFEYSILDNKPLDLTKLQEFLSEKYSEADADTKTKIEISQNKLNFYILLESYGYIMKIKPAKVFYNEDDEEHNLPLLKANCDVDMTFDLMRYMEQYSGAVVMTGDGDFSPVLSYLKYHDRAIYVISRWSRTASEIKKVAENNFIDLERLRNIIIYR